MKTKTVTYFLSFIAAILFAPLMIIYAADLKTSINEYHKIKSSVLPATSDEAAKTAEILDQKKLQLNKIISILVQSVNNQKETIATISSFDQLQKDQLSQSLQLVIDNLTSQNSKINQAKSKENLKTIADSVLNTWLNAQLDLKKSQLSFLEAKITDLTTRLELVIKNTQTESDALKAKNKDVSLLQNKITAASGIIENLKNNDIVIQQKISSLDKNVDFEAIFQDSLKSESESNKTIQTLRQSISDAAAEITRLSKDKK